MSKAKKDGKNTSPSRSKSPKKDANSSLVLNSLSDVIKLIIKRFVKKYLLIYLLKKRIRGVVLSRF
jgi:hypothetical protein